MLPQVGGQQAGDWVWNRGPGGVKSQGLWCWKTLMIRVPRFIYRKKTALFIIQFNNTDVHSASEWRRNFTKLSTLIQRIKYFVFSRDSLTRDLPVIIYLVKSNLKIL